MNKLSIISRKLGKTFNFWMPPSGGYIYRTYEGRQGTMGDQIYAHGSFTGSTLSATPETFEKVCRKWYKDHLKKEAGERE